jgi:hypothetical protein
VAKVSAYERLQIESLLQSTAPPIEPGSGLAVFSNASHVGRKVYEAAIAPAMRAAGLNQVDVSLPAFDHESSLAIVCRYVQVAEAIVVDVTELNPSVMYVLGLAHALGRCPILITAGGDETLPFNFRALRHVWYQNTSIGLVQLRTDLTRALRVFVAAASSSD